MKAVIFGASLAGGKAYEELKEDYSIEYFSDNDKNKWGTMFNEIEIIAPSRLIELKEHIIIIASFYYEEIKKGLVEMGLNRIYCFDVEIYEEMKHSYKTRNRNMYFWSVNIEKDNINFENNSRLDDIDNLQMILLRIKKTIMKLIEEKNYKEAYNLLREWNRVNPNNIECLSLEARVYLEENQYEESYRLNQKVLQQDPYNKIALETEIKLQLFYRNQYKVKENFIKYRLVNKKNQSIVVSSSIDLEKPYLNLEQMKVLQAGEDTGQMGVYSRALNKIGIYAKSFSYKEHKAKLQYDEVVELRKYGGKQQILEEYNVAARLIPQFDIFHFHYGKSLVRGLYDIEIIKELGKKVIFHFMGTDIRLKSIAEQMSPYVYCKNHKENEVRQNLEQMSSLVDDCIVADYELYEYVKDYFKNVHIIRQALDLTKFEFQECVKNKEILIVHAPTDKKAKGTDYVEKSIEELKGKYKFNFQLVTNLSYEEAIKIYKKADIIINNPIGVTYGILVIEAMAMGKVVLTNICDNALKHYPEELPVVVVNPENLTDKIEKLLLDYDLRKELGEKGRKYVEKYHDDKKIAKEFEMLYRKLLEKS